MDITHYVCSNTPEDWCDGAVFNNYPEAQEHARQYSMCVTEVTYEFSDSELVDDFRDSDDSDDEDGSDDEDTDQTNPPRNTEVFYMGRGAFDSHDDDTWMGDRVREWLGWDGTERAESSTLEEATAREALAGWYWWTCCPGCMPDSEADGPYKSEAAAIRAAWGDE